jgi:[ribosomal protein S5]-alanine N-acetyltransferase
VSMHDDITGGRLILRLISKTALSATADRNLDAVARLTGLVMPERWSDVAPLAQRRMAQIEADPAYLPWSVRAIALRETKSVVGYVNFHAAPGSDGLKSYAPKAVELGYTVIAEHRRRGYGGEAVRMLIDWAVNRGADGFVFSISLDNTASLALAVRLGAMKVGAQIDDEDGPEDVYLLRP